MLEVLATGPLTTVQDEGRVGLASSGVPRSGACDRGAYRRGLRLVGTAPGAASLEVTLGGLRVRALAPTTVALTGARCPGVPWDAPVDLRAGDELHLGTPGAGLRSYLAVRGGVDVTAVLGSCSTCTLSGLGPPRLAAGDVLAAGADRLPMPGVDVAPVSGPPAGPLLLTATPGPRADRVGEAGLAVLTGTVWVVGTDSDRVGVRLGGGVLEAAERWRGVELPSEGVLRGAVQVPPSGGPVVFLADAPVTGGYPVVAYLVDDPLRSDVDRLAQARPGQQVRLRLDRGSLEA
ncbi:biotin-dependent carboxyltransferase family protein [Aquipuribacter hungaricus]|uniref:Biotin-dependent carboxyltransferase family protein n=1 Tax=Aquipuribacter hungaricus TaxID=545624 RepID=A0ABV7WMC2_9MICO